MSNNTESEPQPQQQLLQPQLLQLAQGNDDDDDDDDDNYVIMNNNDNENNNNMNNNNHTNNPNDPNRNPKHHLTLSELILATEWEEVVERCCNETTSTRDSSEMVLYVDPITGRTPLHTACAIGATPVSIIQTLLETTGGNNEVSDTILFHHDKVFGDTPLHALCRNGQKSETGCRKIQCLLQHCTTTTTTTTTTTAAAADNAGTTAPAGGQSQQQQQQPQQPQPQQQHPQRTVQDLLLETNVVGGTPFHSACNHNAAIEVLQLLVQTNPYVLKKSTHEGITPFVSLWHSYIQSIPGHLIISKILASSSSSLSSSSSSSQPLLSYSSTTTTTSSRSLSSPSLPSPSELSQLNKTTTTTAAAVAATTTTTMTIPQEGHFHRFCEKVKFLALEYYKLTRACPPEIKHQQTQTQPKPQSQLQPQPQTQPQPQPQTQPQPQQQEKSQPQPSSSSSSSSCASLQDYVIHGLIHYGAPVQPLKVALKLNQYQVQQQQLLQQPTKQTTRPHMEEQQHQKKKKNMNWLCVKDRYGNLPLHVLIERRPYRLKEREGIVAIVESYPEACLEHNHRGQYPLFCAIHNKISWQLGLDVIVKYSILSSPSLLNIPDPQTGLYPFQLAASVGGRKIDTLYTTFMLLSMSPEVCTFHL